MAVYTGASVLQPSPGNDKPYLLFLIIEGSSLLRLVLVFNLCNCFLFLPACKLEVDSVELPGEQVM